MRSILGPIAIAVLAAVCMPPSAHAQVVFTDVTGEAGIALTDWLTESVAWGDYDNDGDEDLYLTVDGPNHLYRNDGGGRFTDVTDAAGVGNQGFSVGTAFGDLDNDGDLDLYVVNFSGGLDVMYRNDGPVGPGGAYRFTDITRVAGTNIERSSRGMAFVDYDRDGLLDIFVMAIGRNILYRNLGDLRFGNVAGSLGLDQDDQGVGVVATDINDNGWPDLFTGNRSNVFSNLYLNRDGVFEDIAVTSGITARGLGMGVAAFDADNDGDLDLVVTADAGEPNRLWRNDSPTGHHWLGLRLRGSRSNRSAIGGRVVVMTSGGSYVQEVSGGAGRGSQNSLPLEFGIGAATVVEELTIRWPSGTVQVLRNVAVDRYVDLTEPGAAIRRSGGRRVP